MQFQLFVSFCARLLELAIAFRIQFVNHPEMCHTDGTWSVNDSFLEIAFLFLCSFFNFITVSELSAKMMPNNSVAMAAAWPSHQPSHHTTNFSAFWAKQLTIVLLWWLLKRWKLFKSIHVKYLIPFQNRKCVRTFEVYVLPEVKFKKKRRWKHRNNNKQRETYEEMKMRKWPKLSSHHECHVQQQSDDKSISIFRSFVWRKTSYTNFSGVWRKCLNIKH